MWIIYLSVILLCIALAYNYGHLVSNREISAAQLESGPVLLDSKLKVETVNTEIRFPSSMAFLGNNDILVLEKNDGTVRRIVNGVMLADPLLKINVSSAGERGMMGIAIMKRANQSKSPYIFLYYTAAATSKSKPFGNTVGNNSTPITNQLVRYEWVNDRLVNGKLIFEVLARGIVHNGGKMVVGPDNNLYITIGDTSGGGNPQKDNLPNGRAGILRFTPDGDSVKDESGKSIMGNTSPTNKYYAYGLRNSFGIGFDPVSGKLWDTENGPSFGDEINLVEPGFNSGWETIQGYWTERVPTSVVVNPNPKDLASFGGKLKYRPPELATYPTVGFTALTFINTSKYGKEYENDMLVGDFHNGNLYHFDLSKNRSDLELNGRLNDKIANNVSDLNDVILGQGFGGITDIKIGADGSIYILAVYQGGDNCYPRPLPGCITYTSSLPGTIFKIVPTNSSK